MRFLKSFSFIISIVSLFAFADEGMWLFNDLPLTHLKDKYGFEPTPQWIEHVMKSSVRFNSGGSGSFISSTGLVLTNHHVGADALQKISTPTHDYLKVGFFADDMSKEIPAKDLELNQLLSIEDVTTRVSASVTPGMSVEEAAKARQATITQIEKESFEATGLRSNVIPLYQGGAYHLYRYKRYTDVRLVFAPEASIAFFGGDPDNFEYPRYDLDMCIFRVYENGQPVQIEHFFKWSGTPMKANDLTFVSGNPGGTSRMLTTSTLKSLRDLRIPYTLNLLHRREVHLSFYSALSEEHARMANKDLFSVQNSRKVYLGRLAGLQDRKLMEAKYKAETELRALVSEKPELKETESAWTKIEEAEKLMDQIYVKRALLEQRHGFNSELFNIARTLVRMAEEDEIPNERRLSEYRDSNRNSLLQSLFSTAPIYKEYEIYKLTDSLKLLIEKLGYDSRLVQNILMGQTPEDRAYQVIQNTELQRVEIRKYIAKGKKKAIAESLDPMIQLAKAVDGAARAVRKTYEERVDEVERQAYARIAKARFEIFGKNLAPDATFTLRLSYGVVKGYEEKGGILLPPWTTLGGAFEHEKAHGARDPWKLPDTWHKAQGALDLNTPFNFVSTADIIGGNSGSPVLNRMGELVGLIFDGNIHSLTADYQYEETRSRATSVHALGMMEALNKIYSATKLATEIGH